MNKTRNNSLRAWLTALCAAAFCLLGTQTAWGQTTQGVKVGDNVTKVNNVAVTSGEIKGANSGTTVTVTVADRTTEATPKVARVTVSSTTIPATSVTALTPSATTVQKDNTFTVTATVSPAYADKLYWMVSDSEKAGFVSGSTTVSTLETTVDASTGTTTATLKALTTGTVTVSVKATNEATTALATTEDITIYTAPTLRTGSDTYNGSAKALLANNGSVEGGTLSYSYRFKTHGGSYGSWSGWSTTAPTGTNAGVYEVKYKVEPDAGYTGGIGETSLGEFTINKANGWVTLSPNYSAGWGTTFPNQKFATISHHGGSLTYSKSGVFSDKLTVTFGNNELILTSGIVAIPATVTVTVTSAATNNYNAASANYNCNP